MTNNSCKVWKTISILQVYPITNKLKLVKLLTGLSLFFAHFWRKYNNNL